MPLAAIRAVSKGQNGVGAFVLQCKRLDFHYCDWAGSSKGMNEFLRTHLARFAASNPSIEVTVSPKPRQHPVVKGVYVNGREKAICVRNMTPAEILSKVQLLKTDSGEKMKKSNRAGRNMVTSINESVRGVWDPFHRTGEKFKI